VRLLLIEDDFELVEALRPRLVGAGFAVDSAEDGVVGASLGAEPCYDAVVLDLGLPRRCGLEVLQDWRTRGIRTPVLVLTARDAWHERVDGLRAGADDYLGKPFRVEELIARLQALIRRTSGQPATALCVDGLTLDQDRQRVVLPDGTPIELTGIEFRLLRYFMHNPDKVLTKARLLDHIYDQHAEPASNLLEVYVRRLRKKIGTRRLRTRRGQGYVFPSRE
jgi:DNA-binding response OmpR family regulator